MTTLSKPVFPETMADDGRIGLYVNDAASGELKLTMFKKARIEVIAPSEHWSARLIGGESSKIYKMLTTSGLEFTKTADLRKKAEQFDSSLAFSYGGSSFLISADGCSPQTLKAFRRIEARISATAAKYKLHYLKDQQEIQKKLTAEKAFRDATHVEMPKDAKRIRVAYSSSNGFAGSSTSITVSDDFLAFSDRRSIIGSAGGEDWSVNISKKDETDLYDTLSVTDFRSIKATRVNGVILDASDTHLTVEMDNALRLNVRLGPHAELSGESRGAFSNVVRHLYELADRNRPDAVVTMQKKRSAFVPVRAPLSASKSFLGSIIKSFVNRMTGKEPS